MGLHISSQNCEGYESVVPIATFIVFIVSGLLYVKTVSSVKEEGQTWYWFLLGGLNCLIPGMVRNSKRKWQYMLYGALFGFISLYLSMSYGGVCQPN